MYAAKVIADSIAHDVRLTTLEVVMPRFVLAEFNTHRMLSRNSASSRAIPVEKRIVDIGNAPFVPDAFAANKRGMQAGEALDDATQERAERAWKIACGFALGAAEELAKLGVHKQWANRLLEPFAWHTVVVTATEWANFFALRCSPEAQPEIRRVAELMREAMAASIPIARIVGEWHLPYVSDEDAGVDVVDLPKLSVARCARVSYLTHDGNRDPAADLALFDRLHRSGHMSPLEHAAQVADDELAERALWRECPEFVGNFRWPWFQLRKTIVGEAVFAPAAAS